MEDAVSVIGVWGMGGVGKITLATHIHNMLLGDEADFDDVIWVDSTLSQHYSICQLQRVIATSINLDISDEWGVKRIAEILLHAFKQMNKCVVILDDVWDHILLEEVGFPVLDHTGIKLILTTRSWEVGQSMNCKENLIRVKPLRKDAAWDLFKKTLGVFETETLPTNVEDLARCVMCQCEGLPLAIFTFAGSMKGKEDLREWKHMKESLDNLENGQCDMDKSVFPVLRYSYDHLTDTELPECFLYCALRDQSNISEGLIRCFVFEKWIDERKRLEGQCDEGHILLSQRTTVYWKKEFMIQRLRYTVWFGSWLSVLQKRHIKSWKVLITV